MSQVLKLEVQRGHLKWKVSDLARTAKVSRPLIYYHFGRTKREILETCLRIYTDDFYGLSTETTREAFLASIEPARAQLSKNPDITVFYLKARAGATFLHDEFLEIEKRYQRKLAKIFPKLGRAEIVALHAVLHGAVSAPFMTTENVKALVAKLARL